MTGGDRIRRDMLVGFTSGGLIGTALGAVQGFVLGALFLGAAVAVLFVLVALMESLLVITVSACRTSMRRSPQRSR